MCNSFCSILLLCCCIITITGCGKSGIHAPLPPVATVEEAEQYDFALWFTHKNKPLPLLASLSLQQQAGELGILFVNGVRIVQCSYADTSVTCTTSLPVHIAPINNAVYDIAKLIAYIICDNKAYSTQKPAQWDIHKETATRYTCINTNKNMTITFILQE